MARGIKLLHLLGFHTLRPRQSVTPINGVQRTARLERVYVCVIHLLGHNRAASRFGAEDEKLGRVSAIPSLA
jgi:hypothetical protein